MKGRCTCISSTTISKPREIPPSVCPTDETFIGKLYAISQILLGFSSSKFFGWTCTICTMYTHRFIDTRVWVWLSFISWAGQKLTSLFDISHNNASREMHSVEYRVWLCVDFSFHIWNWAERVSICKRLKMCRITVVTYVGGGEEGVGKGILGGLGGWIV